MDTNESDLAKLGILAKTNRGWMIDKLLSVDDPNLHKLSGKGSSAPHRLSNNWGNKSEEEKAKEVEAIRNIGERVRAYGEQYKGLSDRELYDLVRNRSRESFYGRYDAVPDYDFYCRKKSWTLAEAVSLLLNLNPKIYTWEKIRKNENDSDKDRRYKELRELIHNSATNKVFGSWTAYVNKLDWMHVNPIEVMNWTINNKLEYPRELYDKVREYHVAEEEVDKDEIIALLRSELGESQRQITALTERPLDARFPKYLLQAIKVFDQCWDDLPDDMKRPVKNNLVVFYESEFGVDTFMQSVINVAKRTDIPTQGKQETGRVKPWKQKKFRK